MSAGTAPKAKKPQWMIELEEQLEKIRAAAVQQGVPPDESKIRAQFDDFLEKLKEQQEKNKADAPKGAATGSTPGLIAAAPPPPPKVGANQNGKIDSGMTVGGAQNKSRLAGIAQSVGKIATPLATVMLAKMAWSSGVTALAAATGSAAFVAAAPAVVAGGLAAYTGYKMIQAGRQFKDAISASYNENRAEGMGGAKATLEALKQNKWKVAGVALAVGLGAWGLGSQTADMFAALGADSAQNVVESAVEGITGQEVLNSHEDAVQTFKEATEGMQLSDRVQDSLQNAQSDDPKVAAQGLKDLGYFLYNGAAVAGGIELVDKDLAKDFFEIAADEGNTQAARDLQYIASLNDPGVENPYAGMTATAPSAAAGAEMAGAAQPSGPADPSGVAPAMDAESAPPPPAPPQPDSIDEIRQRAMADLPQLQDNLNLAEGTPVDPPELDKDDLAQLKDMGIDPDAYLQDRQALYDAINENDAARLQSLADSIQSGESQTLQQGDMEYAWAMATAHGLDGPAAAIESNFEVTPDMQEWAAAEEQRLESQVLAEAPEPENPNGMTKAMHNRAEHALLTLNDYSGDDPDMGFAHRSHEGMGSVTRLLEKYPDAGLRVMENGQTFAQNLAETAVEKGHVNALNLAVELGADLSDPDLLVIAAEDNNPAMMRQVFIQAFDGGNGSLPHDGVIEHIEKTNPEMGKQLDGLMEDSITYIIDTNPDVDSAEQQFLALQEKSLPAPPSEPLGPQYNITQENLDRAAWVNEAARGNFQNLAVLESQGVQIGPDEFQAAMAEAKPEVAQQLQAIQEQRFAPPEQVVPQQVADNTPVSDSAVEKTQAAPPAKPESLGGRADDAFAEMDGHIEEARKMGAGENFHMTVEERTTTTPEGTTHTKETTVYPVEPPGALNEVIESGDIDSLKGALREDNAMDVLEGVIQNAPEDSKGPMVAELGDYMREQHIYMTPEQYDHVKGLGESLGVEADYERIPSGTKLESGVTVPRAEWGGGREGPLPDVASREDLVTNKDHPRAQWGGGRTGPSPGKPS